MFPSFLPPSVLFPLPSSREIADNVMYKIQRAKKGVKKVKAHNLYVHSNDSFAPALILPQRISHELPSNHSKKSVDHEPLLRNIRTGEMTTFKLFEDSEDDSDSNSNPFSDIEEPYQDILSRLH